MTGEPGRVDLQRVEVTVRCARRAYKAAAAVRAGVHAHDARCAAVAWIPELAGHLEAALRTGTYCVYRSRPPA